MVNINPLIAQPPSEVLLENAPLIRVLAQVRFPFLFSIKEISCVAAFQEAIREKYPILQPEQTQGFVPTEPQIIWRFTDINREWRVSLTPNFVTLETVAYSSRTDFLERLENILTALDLHTKPNYIERFGLRYIDRLEEQDIYEIQKLVRQEVAGVSTELKEYVYQAISEYIFNLPEDRGQMLVRTETTSFSSLNFRFRANVPSTRLLRRTPLVTLSVTLPQARTRSPTKNTRSRDAVNKNAHLWNCCTRTGESSECNMSRHATTENLV